jgi:site-specific DNA recombinase
MGLKLMQFSAAGLMYFYAGNDSGWRTKQWVTRKGVTHGGKPFTKGRLFRLLTNPIYIGKVDFQKQTYAGEHEAIVETPIWERVQQILRRNGRSGGIEVRNSYGALLEELMRCGSCESGMVRTYRTNDSRTYRHYICAQANCETTSVSESTIKAAVTRHLRGIGSDRRIVAHALSKAEEQRRSSVADLQLERHAAQKGLAIIGAELRNLAPALLGHGDKEVSHRAADLHERFGQMERRLMEILQELGNLDGQGVDEGDFRVALEQFEPVWDSLNSREHVLVIRALFERVVVHDGKVGRVTVRFPSAAVRKICRGTRKERVSES